MFSGFSDEMAAALHNHLGAMGIKIILGEYRAIKPEIWVSRLEPLLATTDACSAPAEE